MCDNENNRNPLFPSSINHLDGIYAVTDILAFLEDHATNLMDMLDEVPPHNYYLSRQGASGQRYLFGLLRETLEQTVTTLKLKK